ncbi:MAG: Rid family detoxifying hydrolase [Actinomycetota bacterium]
MRTPLTSDAARAVGPYSHGVASDPFVFLSGQTPLDPVSGELVGGGVGAQTQQCFRNLFAVLADDGLDSDDVVKVNVYLTDMDDFAAMNEVYEQQFARPFPARTTVGVAALPLGASVEIELMARRRDS